MKYLVIDYSEGVMDVREFDNENEAISYADHIWDCKWDDDKKSCKRFYILESVNPDEDAEDHFDGNIIKTYK